MSRRTSRSTGTARDYPRTARLNHLVQEIVAEEVERIDDDRLGLLTVVGVDVEPDLRRATVWYTALGAATGDEAGDADDEGDTLVAALAEHRPRLQAAIGRQARLKRTPELTFEPDEVIRRAERVEAILRDLSAGEGAAGENGVGGSAGAGEGPATGAGPGAGDQG
ncbi:MAG TPA: 30S ribosome-binding factor RbfA [Acidimicrobiales bacterium]